jgi:FkbM family methyltransferase
MNLNLFKRLVLNKGALWLSYIRLTRITRKLDKNSVVLDCGANVGDITRKFAATGALVHAFEPDPVAFGILEKKCKNYPNVVLHNEAVWDKETSIQLYSHKHQETGDPKPAYTVSSSIISNKKNIDDEKYQQVRVIDLSAFISHFGRKINVIKLDVEGAETAILRKILQNGTWTCFDKMYVETHETKIPGQAKDIQEIIDLMRQKKVENIKLNWL